jgi:energy-coupling factor transporter ATP-binding protein EcfA2
MCDSRDLTEAGPREELVGSYQAIPGPHATIQSVASSRDQRGIGDDLARLADALGSLHLGPDAVGWSSERDRIIRTIRSYLIPRVVDPAAPMTVVVAGPTGSGKSTLVNSISGMNVSRTGALRPTTRAPVVVTRPGFAGRYGSIAGVTCDVITADAPILESLVLVDAPDLDSNSPGHRAMAEALIDNADMVIFVTSALRYADYVPWQVLRRAESRGAPVVHVLNRVGSRSAGAILDFRSRLAAAGMGHGLITVSEHHLTEGTQRVPAIAVRSLRQRVGELAAHGDVFQGRVFDRVLRSIVASTNDLLRSMAEFADQTDALASELSVYLAERAGSVELGDIGTDLAPNPPARARRLAVRLWRMRFRQIGVEAMEQSARRVVDGFVSIVESDMRHWLSDERVALLERNIEPAELIAEILEIARSSVEAWVAFVARVSADHDSEEPWLGEAILLEAGTTQGELPVVELVFGEDGPVLVDRVRRELREELDRVYLRAGDLVVEAVRRRHGYLEDDALRAALGALTSNFSPAHA